MNKNEIETKITELFNTLRPYLQMDGGDIEFIKYEDNFVYITGRKKNLIILANGENVSPEEIENQIAKADLVKEIIVRETDKVIQAEIFPDYEYAKKKHQASKKNISLNNRITNLWN